MGGCADHNAYSPGCPYCEIVDLTEALADLRARLAAAEKSALDALARESATLFQWREMRASLEREQERCVRLRAVAKALDTWGKYVDRVEDRGFRMPPGFGPVQDAFLALHPGDMGEDL